MTITHATKPILRSFHIYTVTPRWNYDGCGSNEKDRQLLVEYDVVVEEVNLLSPEYKSIIIQKLVSFRAVFVLSITTLEVLNTDIGYANPMASTCARCRQTDAWTSRLPSSFPQLAPSSFDSFVNGPVHLLILIQNPVSDPQGIFVFER